MADVYNNNNKLIQIKKYIKVPDRRLLNGLLYVNVVNHNDNNARDDFVQQCYDIEAGAGSGSVDDKTKYSDSFTWGGKSTFSHGFGGFQNRGRDGMKHSFADYDCFVFHVAGGMTLAGGAVAPDPGGSSVVALSGGSALYNSGNNYTYVTQSGDDWRWRNDGDTIGILTDADLDATWYQNASNPFGDYCSHFLKYNLISRINNASGHGLLLKGASVGAQADDPVFMKTKPQHIQTYRNPVNQIVNQADPATINHEYVLSHGKYATTDTLGVDLGAQGVTSLGTGNTNAFYKPILENDVSAGETQNTTTDDDGNFSNPNGNTYYTPVSDIKIYGIHKFIPMSHRDNTGGMRVWSISGSGAQHETDYWSLVIDIGMFGSNPNGSSSNGTPTKSILKSQVNVSFQAFGETNKFNVSDSQH